MAKFIKGDVVVVPFPFSDLTETKKRPTLVIASLEGDDIILCQITSKTIRDNYAMALDDEHSETGSLQQSSNIRPNRLFTADSHIILYPVGRLKADKLVDVINKTIEIIRS